MIYRVWSLVFGVRCSSGFAGVPGKAEIMRLKGSRVQRFKGCCYSGIHSMIEATFKPLNP